MNIVVFNTAADSSGALSELERFHDETSRMFVQNIHWIYILGKAQININKKENAEIIKFPWTKRSWLYRLIFDYFFSNQIAKKLRADLIVSFQNISLPIRNRPQLLYVQLCFPFINHRFRIIEPKLWIYQNIIGIFIKHSIKKANFIVVQTEWMKQACIKATNVPGSNFRVVTPTIGVPIKENRFSPAGVHRRTFFFPATAMRYKNHKLLIDAFAELVLKTNRNYRLIFTINGDENRVACSCKAKALKLGLDVDFRGTIPRVEVFSLYSKSILVFPSLLETVGLPLIEAMTIGTIILAYDAEYSREVLSGYSDAYFFRTKEELISLMLAVSSDNFEYHGGLKIEQKKTETWEDIINDFIYEFSSQK